MKENDYDFEPIISREVFQKNKREMREELERRQKIDVKSKLLFILSIALLVFFSIVIYQFFTVETTRSTPVGNYSCRGGVIEICSSSDEVAAYLGVE